SPEVSIHTAAYKGNIEAVKQHLDAGADVNAKGYRERTPLHYAAHGGQKEIAELLIAAGADVNAKDDDGETPLDWAITHNADDIEIAGLLRKQGAKTAEELNTPSRRSQAAGTPAPVLSQKNARPKSFPKTTKELMFGANPTLTDKDKAFLSAAKEGKLDEVKSLLEEGVDVDCSDAFSCTGLFWAAANNHKSIVEYLIEKGANLNAGAGVGGTPLARAAYEGHVEVVELLIAKGADVNAKDVSGGSPLDSADESVVDLLRKHGAK
ncbi:ankyrin repeat domain-containing protein, partial [bacterium]|nr:ankyrin repeat domain-containing protein [bacterium]